LRDHSSVSIAEELLLDLGELTRSSSNHPTITSVGRRMLAFPLHPRYGRMLLAAQELSCVYRACLVAALTQGRDLLLRKQAKEVTETREEVFSDDQEAATS